MSKLIQLWKSETPIFFKKVIKFALWLGTILTLLWGANTTLVLGLPEVVLSVIKYGIVACIVISGTSKFTTTDPTI